MLIVVGMLGNIWIQARALVLEDPLCVNRLKGRAPDWPARLTCGSMKNLVHILEIAVPEPSLTFVGIC
jgi:hypothetical protein